MAYDRGVIKVDSKTWALGLQQFGLLNLLNVMHFWHNNINDICLCQLIALVHDNFLWLGDPISIDDMLIHQITKFPYQGEDLRVAFKGKG